MKSMIIHKLGERLRLTNIPDPVPQKNEILLRVLSCGLNFADTLLIEGKYQQKPPLPFAPGLEVCGVVEEMKSSSPHLRVGDRVVSVVNYGGLSEKVTASKDTCFHLTSGIHANIASGFLIAYGTSYLSLKERAKLKKGEILLVLGASGGVGLTAVELGKVLGAKVIAIAKNFSKLSQAEKLGADYLFENDDANLVEKIKSVGGADVIYDPVGGNLSTKVFKAANQCARVIPIGFASGIVPQLPLNIVMVKNIEIIGVHWGAYQKLNLKKFRKSNNELINLLRCQKLVPEINDVFPLKEANEALDMIRNRTARGKIVVDMTI